MARASADMGDYNYLNNTPSVPGHPGPAKPRDRVMMEIILQKEAGVGLGIGLCCVPSGDGCPGIYIHTLSPGSVAHMDGRLRCGDEIMEINDTVVYNMALNDVYTVLSQCAPGPVHIIISRHHDPKVSEQQLNDAIAQAVENSKLRKDKSQWSIDGLRRLDPGSHSRQRCERCLERSFSQLTVRRAQKAMTRSCSDNTTSHQHNHCLTIHNLHKAHHNPSARVHSLDTPKSMRETWSDNRLSVPVYPDEDYNVPYNSAAANLPCQQALDLALRGEKSTCRVRAAPLQHCWPQDVTSEEGYNGDSSGSSRGSPVRDGGLESSSHTSCQEGEQIREQSEGTGEDLTHPDTAACTSNRLHTGDQSAVLCCQPKRGALRRQARVDQQTREQLREDPWVRLSDSSPEELPEIHRHPSPDAADRTQPTNVHSKPVAMTEQDNMPELNGTNGTSDLPSNTTPENTFETPPGAKMAPPVAPKPVWFRQSLRKLRDEQGQKKQAKSAEQRPTVVFNRSSGVRSASSSANLSIKQKIHSFETFSSPEGPEKEGNRRPVAPSASLSLEKESGSPPFSLDRGKGEHKIPEVIQASVGETDSTHVSAITSSASEASRQTTAKETEDEPQSIQSPTDLPLSETISEELDSGIHDSHSAPVHDDRNVFLPKQECELVREDLTRSAECKVLPPVTSVRSNEAEGESPAEGMEEDGAQSQGKLSTPATDSNPPRGLEGESLERILAFSNQVSQAWMRSLPMSPCHGNPHTPDLQDPSAEDFTNPDPDSSDRGFSVSLATLRECTIERGEGGSHDQAAPTSACAHSLISAIPSEEIQRMIQEVQDLDEETLKQLADIHVVSLHKEEGAGLGFSIAGGSDLESKALTVHRVFPSGLAAQEGTIQKGNEVLSINGQTLRGVTHADATAAMRQARSLKLAVVVVCKRDGEGRQEDCRSEEPHPAEEEQGSPVSVELEKTAGGVGFTLEGGKGSIHGDRPLVINRIFTGGAAEQIGLQRGDELLQVQGVSLQDMTRFEAWNMIKALPEGAITAVIRRRQGGAE